MESRFINQIDGTRNCLSFYSTVNFEPSRWSVMRRNFDRQGTSRIVKDRQGYDLGRAGGLEKNQITNEKKAKTACRKVTWTRERPISFDPIKRIHCSVLYSTSCVIFQISAPLPYPVGDQKKFRYLWKWCSRTSIFDLDHSRDTRIRKICAHRHTDCVIIESFLKYERTRANSCTDLCKSLHRIYLMSQNLCNTRHQFWNQEFSRAYFIILKNCKK